MIRILDREKLRSDLTKMAWEKIDKGEISDSYIIMDIHRGDEKELMAIANQWGLNLYENYGIDVPDDFFDKK